MSEKRLLISCLVLVAACQVTPNNNVNDNDNNGGYYVGYDTGDDGGDDTEENSLVFDDSFVHDIQMEIDPGASGELRLGNRERVPATFVFDGVELEDVGIRLKGNRSGREMDGKAQFSVKFNEFVQGQRLHGLKKLTINNNTHFPGFAARPLGYEIWRRAGVPAPRTAYTTLTINGEYFGLYTIEEGYNEQLLENWFEDTSGNLYEGQSESGSGADVTEINRMDLDTNEELNDRSDLIGLAAVLLESPDETLLQDLSEHLDIAQFMTYWAIERLVYQWDGYGTMLQNEDCCSPHNYSIYHDPLTDLFSFLPRGGDALFRDPEADVGRVPRSRAVLAVRLFDLPLGRAMLANRMEELLDEVWDVPSLEAYLARHEALALEQFVEGGREEITLEDLTEQFEICRTFLRERAQIVRERLSLGL